MLRHLRCIRIFHGSSTLIHVNQNISRYSSDFSRSITRTFSSSSRIRANSHRTRFNSQFPEDLKPRNWHPRIQLAALSFVGGSVYYAYHLEQVPMTGRWRFIDVTSQEEHNLEMQTYQELLNEYEGKILHPSHPLSLFVRKVVNRLLEASELGRLKDETDFGTPGDTWNNDSTVGETHPAMSTPRPQTWKLLVVNDLTINAMASYGTIVVFVGILPFCGDEDGLAAVIGHEIGHVVARHIAERLSSVTVFKAIALLVDFLLQSTFNVGGILTTLTLQLPNSRKQELEADQIGITITARACFNPEGAPQVQKRLAAFQKLQTGKKSEGIGLLNTHPLYKERIQFLESLLPNAYAVRAASSSCVGMEENFNAFVETMTDGFNG